MNAAGIALSGGVEDLPSDFRKAEEPFAGRGARAGDRCRRGIADPAARRLSPRLLAGVIQRLSATT